MNFNDWWNGPSGFGNFTNKELKVMNGGPSTYRDYVEDLGEAFHAGRPKPSDDMTVPKENPYKEYLLWTRSDGWFVGYYDEMKGGFYWTAHDLDGDEVICPTHWLTLPDDPE